MGKSVPATRPRSRGRVWDEYSFERYSEVADTLPSPGRAAGRSARIGRQLIISSYGAHRRRRRTVLRESAAHFPNQRGGVELPTLLVARAHILAKQIRVTSQVTLLRAPWRHLDILRTLRFMSGGHCSGHHCSVEPVLTREHSWDVLDVLVSFFNQLPAAHADPASDRPRSASGRAACSKRGS
jgi:hypothetical protein